MLSNTAVKIGALLLFALPAVLVFGEIYSGITGQPATNGFVKIYSVLLMIPGASISIFCSNFPFSQLQRQTSSPAAQMLCSTYQPLQPGIQFISALNMSFACQHLSCSLGCQGASAVSSD